MKAMLKDKINLILKRMFETRPQEEIKLMPYVKPSFATRNLRQDISIDLNGLFPYANCGDFAYISTAVKSSDNTEVSLLVYGAEFFYINGEKKEVCGEAYEQNSKIFTIVKINVNKGFNTLVFKCVKDKDFFGLDYQISHVNYPFLWVCDYLLWERDTIPLPEFEDEQGFCVSELIKTGEQKNCFECEAVFPPLPSEDNIIDFNLLYDAGYTAWALSFAKEGGTLNLKSESPIKIYVNGKESTDVKKGDTILVMCQKTSDAWGFESLSNDILCLPQLTSKRQLHWLLLGGFEDKALPEIQFTAPYTAANGEATFWRFSDPDTYLRPYLDTCFFGQWFYGLMVGHYGILRASEYNPEYYSYFKDSMSILAKYFRYMRYDAALFGDSTFLKRSVKTDDLDSIGTIGMNLYELYIRETDEGLKEDILYVLNVLADSIYKIIPRMEDNTFYRIHTMWADDTYMSCPFLVRMGNLTGNTKYYDEAVLQLKNYTKKLYIESKNIFSHIYFPEDKKANLVAWGRGNGWVYLAFAEVIEHLPKDYPGKDELEAIFKKAVCGLIALQDSDGMWHQVLNMPSSYQETSCTAIFSIALSKGIKLGILDADIYLPVIKRAVDGLIKISIMQNGDISGVCRGSGCSYDASYYASLATICGDDHGTGVVIAAMCELMDLIKEREINHD